MPYIIDGNNLIGCSPDISLGDPDARDKLIQLIRKFQESKQTKVTLVFDGMPSPGGQLKNVISAKFTVLFPRHGHSADDEIKRLLNAYHQLSEVVLVTSDRELKLFAREKGAKTRNSVEFYYELRKSFFRSGKREENQKRIDHSLSKHEVEQWLKIFNSNR